MTLVEKYSQMNSCARGFGLVFLAMAATFAGCSNGAKPPAAPASAGATHASSGPGAGNQCESVLSSIDDIFQLLRLGRTTAVSDGVSRLNDWQRACGAEAAAGEFKLPPEVRKLLTEEDVQALTSVRFDLRDGEHIRDCLLERTVSEYAPGAGQTDLEKVTNVFGHVVRAIGQVPEPLHDLPLTVYDVYLLGKGTAADRAWIFASILRQLKVDAVLILPRSSAKVASTSEGQPVLVGVLLDGEVYLFDSQAGVAIPSIGGATGSRRAATLAEAASNAQVLKQLDARGKPYAIRAADLEHPGVAIIGDTAFWSARMQALQTQFVGSRAMIISDPLVEAGEGSGGVWSRVAKAGKDRWAPVDIELWDYPEKTLAAHMRMNSDQQDTLEGLMKPFDAYLNVVTDPVSGRKMLAQKEHTIDRSADQKVHPGVHINVRTTVGEQMHARLTHLSGALAEAVKSYQDVRGRSRDVLNAGAPLPVQSSHSRAIEDAMYWIPLCQYEQGEYKSAVKNLRQYLDKPEERSKWARESRYLLALSLAASGDRAAAIGLLEEVDPDDLEYTGYRLLIRQWQSEK